MSKLGFVMLIHASLDRGAQVARHWATAGCPIVIHVDGRVGEAEYRTLRERLGDLSNVRFAPRHRCEWGTWSIVAATLDAARLMLTEFPEVRHVYLVSGSCLPLRPVGDLTAYLDQRGDTDFIESVTTADVAWTKGGLDTERFHYRFPVSWRRHRWLFDRLVGLQRRLGLRRAVPAGLVPHLGSQWWCLTRHTLEGILNAPDRERLDRYFRNVWIPDESYFQTLARRYARRIESRSLTLSKFDFQGKPHIFYDDHLPLLRRSDCFVARKAWPHATQLYDHFLGSGSEVSRQVEPNPGRIDKVFTRAAERRTKGRPGLRMQSRFPRDGWENGKTAGAYSVFEGFSDLFDGFERWLERHVGGRVHGHLFAPDRVQFAGGETTYNGALSDSPKLRDYDPEGFLTSLIWNTRGERQCFQFGPADRQEIGWFLCSDRNAHISVITGAWVIPLFLSSHEFPKVRSQAAHLQATEAKHLAQLRSVHTKASVKVWTLGDFLESPVEFLNSALDDLGPRTQGQVLDPPRLAPLSGLNDFLQRLRNEGMNPYIVGDIPTEAAPSPQVSMRDVAAG